MIHYTYRSCTKGQEKLVVLFYKAAPLYTEVGARSDLLWIGKLVSSLAITISWITISGERCRRGVGEVSVWSCVTSSRYSGYVLSLAVCAAGLLVLTHSPCDLAFYTARVVFGIVCSCTELAAPAFTHLSVVP